MIDRISLLIKAKNLSAAQFADEIGVQRSSISHLMSGRNKPSLDLIQKTLQKFPEVSSEWLLFGKGEMMRELNLFDSQARATGNNYKAELSSDNETSPGNEVAVAPQTIDRPAIYEAEDEMTEINSKIIEQIPVNARINKEQSGTEERKPRIVARNEPAGDTDIKTIKKDRAIDQIIVLYDDHTFIAYSPEN